MIIAMTGPTGSGKSLSSVKYHLLPALKKGRHVYTNITGLNPMMLGFVLGMHTYEVKRLLHYVDIQKDLKSLDDVVLDLSKNLNSILILDECHLWLTGSDYKKLENFRVFLSLHRKGGFDVVLITQHVNDLWDPIINRIHETHVFDRGKLGIKTQYYEHIFAGADINRKPMATHHRRDDKRIYNLYQSRDQGSEETLSYLSIWSNKSFVIRVVFIGFALTFIAGFFLTHGIFGDMAKTETKLESAPRMEAGKTVIYVRYVSCDLTSCRGVLPDGSSTLLPVDYESGKYPFTVRRVPHGQKVNSVPAVLPGN